MLRNFEQTAALIREQKLLHIAGAGALLRQLPRGNWIGGSTEYFMAETGGLVSYDLLYVTELAFDDWRIASYGKDELSAIAADSCSDGFSLVILPTNSEAQQRYAHAAAEYEGMFLKTIAGWISGYQHGKPEDPALAVDGLSGSVSSERVVALHIHLPAGLRAELNIINIFSPDTNGPVFTFDHDTIMAKKCRVDGKETDFLEYISENRIDGSLPLVGDYAGTEINVSLGLPRNGGMSLGAPVFRGIEYRFARPVPDYAAVFQTKIAELSGVNPLFTCNCIHNFNYGKLKGKALGGFYGPISYGEIAWQLLNQTLVYLHLEKAP